MKALIFDIKKFAIHDGPGIRTTIFFKGCNLHCPWCHNPESINSYPEVVFFPERCIGCGRCLEACESGALRLVEGKVLYQKPLCQSCGRCAEACYASARVIYGKWMTLEEVMGEILKDKPFYENSGGGATFSGGEPLLYPEFVSALAELCHENGVTVAIDTAGAVRWSAFEAVIPHTDYFLVDLKMMNPKLHTKYCGASLELIVENLERLSANGARIFIRVPIVPGYTDSEENLREIAHFASRLRGVECVELLPYHRLGEDKYRRLGRPYPLEGTPAPSPEKLEQLASMAGSTGAPVKVRT